MTTSTHRLSIAAAMLAVLCTGMQLAAIEALAGRDAVAAAPRAVELERVVITGKRIAPADTLARAATDAKV